MTEPVGRETARALARARLVLRVAKETHKRSISAHKRSLREISAELRQLENACEALGIGDLVIDDNAKPQEAQRNDRTPRT